MALITLRDVSIRFGEKPLLENVNFSVQPGERICLLGRNGEGKSTLMRIISGRILPDSGEVTRQQGLIIGKLPQEIPDDLNGTVLDMVFSRMGDKGRQLLEYNRLCALNETDGGADTQRQKRLAMLQQVMDTENGWHLRQQAENILSRMHLPPNGKIATFSAGMKRQALLAAALSTEPDLLLLDEPTNHLDMEAIQRLESFLLKWNGALILITHDRMMIRKLATRILELDRASVRSWECGYDLFLQRSQERLEAEEKADARFDKKLSAEEAWIRQGIKARRTRNEGRVRELEQLRELRRTRRDRTGNVRMTLDAAHRSGKMVAVAKDISFAYGDRPLIANFNCTVLRGDRIGIIGPNGAGKSTLVKLLLGELSPVKGHIRYGTHLQVVYFDQLRSQIDERKTVQENVSPGADMMMVGGKQRHVIGYLKDFLFSPDRARSPVRVLSGGEKNRLLLARLFSRPANVLVLDEPTNDLDVETLELLEALLVSFDGTVLLVSHDRTFINHVVTSTLVFEKNGRVESYVGGYDDWQMQAAPPSEAVPKPEKTSARKPSPATGPKKRSYLAQRELDALPDLIESLEARQQELFSTLADPDFYRQTGEHIAAVKKELSDVDAQIEAAFARMEELEADADESAPSL
ncbi:ATP-binding cassette domain-containing protein [Desulfosarcina sp. OttesenSCG-928-A07]|nr:ATP-binding cassette domain-containing protein [Desulfosarcina sp. OttesenSCG-928-G17]MDL2328147.1 ATP-binding cassette domain-containing protein [Desulfosarcina sp. OttesenSCG-928-A07]